MSMPSVVQIEEFQSVDLEGLNPETDLSYLRSRCFKYSESSVSPYRVTELKNGKTRIENSSYSGIIQLDGIRIHFSTKVRANLFYMLSFLRDESAFCCDLGRVIDIEEGFNFFDVLGRLYLNELEEIFRRGFCRRYVKRQENIPFLKGKVLVKGQIRNKLARKAKFHCRYDDLTYDNLENQIVLAATNLLIPQISHHNDELRGGLIRARNVMRDEVSLARIGPEDCDKIQFCKINDYYETIIKFSKAILQSYFIRSEQTGAAKGFNFVVNMNKVYEDFVAGLVLELVDKDRFLNGLTAVPQAGFDSLVRENRLITKPDIIIRKKNSNETPFIIDAKYKRQENNADYYQVIAYALAVPGAEACFLIYPDNEQAGMPPLTLDPSPLGNDREPVKIHTLKINLLLDKKLSFEEYIQEMKSQIKRRFLECESLRGYASQTG